jgi:hypothetical protein
MPLKAEVSMEPMVIVGIVQGVILAGTIYVIWKQVETARNAQRAWVMVDVEHDDKKWADRKTHIIEGTTYVSNGKGGITGGDNTSFYAVLVCRNEGSSPAWILEKRAKFEILSSLPPRPDFESAQFTQAGPVPIGTGRALPHTDELPFLPAAVGHQEPTKMVVIYGVVKYRDIFGKHRQTTFAYRIVNRELRRLEGYPEYNKNT